MFEWITIAAIIAGPVLALFIQRVLDWWRERDKRRKSLYFTLMGTRAMFNSPEHVQALNSIDVVFRKDEDIGKLWKKVLDHLALDTASNDWGHILDDLRSDLYRKIGDTLGYKYTTDYIKRGIYFPKYHGDFILNQAEIYAGLAKALKDGKLKVELAQEPPQPPVRIGKP
jgi:hypothetical protein